MEYVESDLKKLMELEPHVPLNEHQITTIMYNTLTALNFIHKANIVHRDIKPGNILIDSDSTIKICDFGLARNLVKESEAEKNFKQKKSRAIKKTLKKSQSQYMDVQDYKVRIAATLQENKGLGDSDKRMMSHYIATRIYRPPEIILTQKKYDQTSDIWALGCILAELLYSSEPYADTIKYDPKSRYLFPGTSCYPLSPVNSNSPSESRRLESSDQLLTILKTVGKLGDVDSNFIKDEEPK